MQAVLSGQAGLALVQDGKGGCLLLRPDQSAQTASPADYPRIFGTATDLEYHEAITLEQTHELLRQRWRQERALLLACYLMDAGFRDETRRLTAAEFAPLSSELAFVRQTLYLRPAPATADLEGARRCGAAVPALAQLFADLIQDQAQIARLEQAWHQTEAARADQGWRPAAALRHARDLGCFVAVAELLRNGKNPLAYLFSKQVPKADQVWLTPWLNALRQPQARPQLEREERHTGGKRKQKPAKRSAHQQFSGVQKQLEAASQHLAAHDLAFCRRIVADLVRSQQPEHLVRSLCKLAQQAHELGYDAFQLELTTQAVEVSAQDRWAWAQHGHALLANGQAEAARDAYRQAQVLGAQAVGLKGEAQALLALNQLDEALSTFERVAEDFPDDPVARTGRAQVLLALNRTTDALDAYDAVIARFPQDVVARNGRAQVLLELHRLDDALSAYDQVIALFPQDVFARTGRAEVLVRMARLDDALQAYRETQRRFPHDIVCQHGLAYVLIKLARPAEALPLLPETPAGGDWIGFHIRGMAYVALAEYEQAEQVFRAGVDAPPGQQRYFRGAAAMLKLRRNQVPAAEELEGDDLASLTLRAHAEGLRQDQPAMQATIATLRAMPEHRQCDNETLVQELEDRFSAGRAQYTLDWLVAREMAVLAFVMLLSLQRRMAY